MMDETKFLAYWFGAERENAEMVALAQELKAKGWRLFILSNNFSERTAYYRKTFAFLSLFEGVAFSHETGCVKPEEKAFTTRFARYDLVPEEAFYFDDKEENVEAARSLGMEAYPFESVEHVKEILEK